MKVVHLTSVHSRYDTRVFLKECCSLVQAGFDVSLIVADNRGDEQKDGVQIIDVGASQSRIKRILHTTQLIFKEANLLDADIYHFHDPELIPVGLKLKQCGKKVIFDAHEDVPKQLLNKPYLNGVARKLISWCFACYENFACRHLDAIVAATPSIREKYLSIHEKSIDVKNFPILGELSSQSNWKKKKKAVCYIGGISRNRGAIETVNALELTKTNASLLLAGRSIDSEATHAMQRSSGWDSVQDLGFLDREGIKNVLSQSVAGLVTLHAMPNYLDSLPIKMFEYMSAGIPVIASDFPLWRSIVESSNCGFCVDPLNIHAIAEKIDTLIDDLELAQELGENGRRAVHEKYNWDVEAKKLISLYKSLSK